MRWQQPKDDQNNEIDEHESPTEPMTPVVTSSFAPTIPYAEPAIPMPSPYERPFPYQNLQYPAPPAAGSPEFSPSPVYPVLPPAHKQGDHGPAGGTAPDNAGFAYNPVNTRPRSRQRAFPILVGVFFVAIQFLLLVSFALKLLNLGGNTSWIGIIYAVSGIFVLPFHVLLQSINIPIPNLLQIDTLIAILAYGLLSRLLVRLLKILMR
jgi:hypothetical protein